MSHFDRLVIGISSIAIVGGTIFQFVILPWLQREVYSMRNIICESCAERRPAGMHPEDAAMGFHKRTAKLRVKKPADHAIEVNGVKQEQMETIMCDDCGKPMPDGTHGVAISMWRGGEMAAWEHEYGEIIP